MKKSINSLVLLSLLATTIPISSVIAEVNGDSEETIIEVPAEAVTLSEKLISENPEANAEVVTEAEPNTSEEAPRCIKSGVAYSPKMNKEQRKELFVHGQITDCEGNIWNIKVIPGSDVSKEMTIKSWRFAGQQTEQMFKIETYKKAANRGKRATKASFDFTKNSSKLLKKGVWDYMIVEGVYNNLILDNARVWKQAGVTVANLDGSFSWLFGAIYAGILKPVTLTGVNIIKSAYHFTVGTVILVGGIAGTTGGLVATVASPILVPTVELMTRPLLAIGSILTTGSIIPGAIYVWNGTAWITTQFSDIPDKETIIGGVSFVRLENPKEKEKPRVELNAAALNEIIKVGVMAAAQKTQVDRLEQEKAELQKQVRELQNQIRALSEQQEDLAEAHSDDPTVRKTRRLIYDRNQTNIVLSAEVVNASENEESLKKLINNYVQENGIQLSEEELEFAKTEVKDILSKLSVK